MIVYKTGNLLDDDADILVNTVNCVGVMGKGIALAFKEKYPEMFASYRDFCKNNQLDPGRLWWYNYPNRIVCCFATKNHWKHPSKIEWIENGLKDLRWHFEINYFAYFPQKPPNIAIPKLGCGEGGLDWRDVKPLIIEALEDLPIEVRIYE